MTDACNVYTIALNSATTDETTAKEKKRAAKSSLLSCVPPNKRAEIVTADASPDITRLTNESLTVDTMSQFILKQLGRETGSNSSFEVLSDLATETSETLEKEIEELKSNIRTERRRFLDADPSAPTAVAGLYFTQEPDNNMIIIFLSCFGSFLLVAGLIVLYGYVPLDMVKNADFNMRLTIVGSSWVAALLLMYVGFITFT